ncbi:hypothetical protein EYF80_055839 [Liparis tanakae]|uniref:Uncharacterized protein n=1 Tax=Liparis tanakae TaxID=230148 RepID=A0A4Z2EZ07_9TELE|nr:hypothetical protein EYF80_055839 [Liparis tanakae]
MIRLPLIDSAVSTVRGASGLTGRYIKISRPRFSITVVKGSAVKRRAASTPLCKEAPYDSREERLVSPPFISSGSTTEWHGETNWAS